MTVREAYGPIIKALNSDIYAKLDTRIPTRQYMGGMEIKKDVSINDFINKVPKIKIGDMSVQEFWDQALLSSYTDGISTLAGDLDNVVIAGTKYNTFGEVLASDTGILFNMIDRTAEAFNNFNTKMNDDVKKSIAILINRGAGFPVIFGTILGNSKKLDHGSLPKYLYHSKDDDKNTFPMIISGDQSNTFSDGVTAVFNSALPLLWLDVMWFGGQVFVGIWVHSVVNMHSSYLNPMGSAISRFIKNIDDYFWGSTPP